MTSSIRGEGITAPIQPRTATHEPAASVDVSVVISTYNRCTLLARALESLQNQDTADVSYEILVVDNNSTDETRAVTQRMINATPGRLRYVFESKQGLSYARNAGIASARAKIIAFTDDDVRVANNWVSRIKAGFAAEPSVDFLGGKVLPHWDEIPPACIQRWEMVTQERPATLLILVKHQAGGRSVGHCCGSWSFAWKTASH